jgi:hypothetical protein
LKANIIFSQNQILIFLYIVVGIYLLRSFIIGIVDDIIGIVDDIIVGSRQHIDKNDPEFTEIRNIYRGLSSYSPKKWFEALKNLPKIGGEIAHIAFSKGEAFGVKLQEPANGHTRIDFNQKELDDIAWLAGVGFYAELNKEGVELKGSQERFLDLALIIEKIERHAKRYADQTDDDRYERSFHRDWTVRARFDINKQI